MTAETTYHKNKSKTVVKFAVNSKLSICYLYTPEQLTYTLLNLGCNEFVLKM